jgi:hypothetical protein
MTPFWYNAVEKFDDTLSVGQMQALVQIGQALGKVVPMKPKERIEFFWATGVLPGTIFEDFNDRPTHEHDRPRRRRPKWLRLITLGILG